MPSLTYSFQVALILSQIALGSVMVGLCRGSLGFRLGAIVKLSCTLTDSTAIVFVLFEPNLYPTERFFESENVVKWVVHGTSVVDSQTWRIKWCCSFGTDIKSDEE